MSIIDVNIPTQGFEIVRDVIGAILKTELENQRTLKGCDYPINVFVGRSTPFQHAEVLMINVLCESANYSQAHEQGVHSSTTYYIDVYASAKETIANDGGLNATILRDQFLGMCRFILQDHKYKTLGLPLGTIMGTYVEGFDNFEPSNSQDSAFVKMGRITFNVRIVENQSLWAGIDSGSSFTDVKLDLTDQGYKYEFIN